MYESLLKRLYGKIIHGVKLGLKNIQKLDEELSYPSKKFKSIHVAGTNGKGSVSTKISNVLFLSGYKVGLFTSPHISSFRERIQINEKNISKDKVEEALIKIFYILEKTKIEATFFEINTIMAFYIFAKEKVDFAVIEVGLGGRFDSTNIILPILSIITSINFDHTDILGDSLDKIAFEKAGIIKKNVPLIIGPKADFNIIKERASFLGSDFYKVKDVGGWYDNENIEIASLAIELLKNKFFIKESCLKYALMKRPPCRLEIFKKNDNRISEKFKNLPEAIIFDVAHNQNGFINLFRAIKHHFKDFPIRVIVGMSKDKNVLSSANVILKNASFTHVIDVSNDRLMSKEDLSTFFPVNNMSYKSSLEESIRNAVYNSFLKKEILVVCGSFFIMKDVKLQILS